MDGYESTNGHHPPEAAARTRINPYADALTSTQPREIVEYEMSSDPYANMLPDTANINAARTMSRWVARGSRGNRFVMVVSLILLVVLILPFVLVVLARLSG